MSLPRFLPERSVIVVTGGIVLCLQLVASRIMAPFFGVSLYIWTGILSITLLCLAFGYLAGGGLCRNRGSAELAALFHTLPALAGLAMAGATALYPHALGPLARFDLVAGTFVAATLLLALPLVGLSALNPLLVAIERADAGPDGDAGAGWVFFLSTLGSVAGVLVAAFGLISHLPSRVSVLLLAAVLSLCSMTGLGLRRELPGRWRAPGLLAAAAGLAATLLLAAGAPRQGEPGWTVLDRRPSPFGSLAVVETVVSGAPARLLIHDGLVQNGIRPDGGHALLFTHALEAGALALNPRPARILVLGLGAGVLPSAFAARGALLDVVEINPTALAVAKEHFGYRPGAETGIFIADARAFAHDCPAATYDAVFVDLFAGDGVPEHLTTRNFFDDLKRCLAEDGMVAMNSFTRVGDSPDHLSLLATLAASFGRVAVIRQHRDAPAAIVNAFLFAARRPDGLDRLEMVRTGDAQPPLPLDPALVRSLPSLELLDSRSPRLAGAAVLTDDANAHPALAAATGMAFRAAMAWAIPDAILVD